MVSSVFKKEELALILNLPSSDSKEKSSTDTKSLSIEISKTQIALNGKTITIKEFSKKLSKVLNKKIPVILRVDEMVEYRKVILVIDTLKKYKLENLNLITKRKN